MMCKEQLDILNEESTITRKNVHT